MTLFKPQWRIRHKNFVRVILSFMLSTVTQPLIGAVDTAVVGRLPDPAYIAGVAVATVIFNTIYWLLGFLRVGSTGFSAQALAAGDPDRMWKALLLPGCLALGFGLLIILLQKPIFAGAMLIMDLEEPARTVCATYYDIYIWMAPVILTNYVVLGWLMGAMRIRASLFMQIGGNVVNMVLDVLFVLVLGWGVPGVALASVLGCLFSLVVGLRSLLPAMPRRVSPLSMLITLPDMVRIMRVNGNLFLRTVCLMAQINIFMAVGAGFGTLQLSANSIIMQIVSILSYLLDGIANGAGVFAGRAAGAHKRDMMESIRRYILQWGIGTTCVLTLVYAVGRTHFLALLTDLPEVLETAYHYSLWAVLYPAVAFPGLTFYGIFTGISLTRPVFLSTLQALICFVLCCLIAVPTLGNHGLWLSYLVFYLGRSLFLVRYWPEVRKAPVFQQ